MKKYIKIILSFFIISGTIFLTHRELNAQDGKSFDWSGSSAFVGFKSQPTNTCFKHYIEITAVVWDGYATPISYVAGFHLNNRLYLGGGVGLNYNFEGLTREDDMGPKSGYDHKHKPGFYAEPQPLYIHAWSFPLFANVRYYFNNYKIKPFISLNAGVFISGDLSGYHKFYINGSVEDDYMSYNPSRFFVNPSVCGTFHFGKSEAYAGVSLLLETWPVCNMGVLDSVIEKYIGLVFGISL